MSARESSGKGTPTSGGNLSVLLEGTHLYLVPYGNIG